MLVSLVALAVAAAPLGPPETADSTASEFLAAFKRMDEARFDAFFAPDVTMFFPDGPFPDGRVEGRQAVLSAFHSFFKRARLQGRTSLNISPLGQRIQLHGDIAIVTFHLDAGDAVGRRSIILRKMGKKWSIVHFHASAIEK